jgi:hypothetical protein
MPAASATPADVRALVRRYGVQTVLAERTATSPTVLALLSAALGRPQDEGGMAVWWHADRRAGPGG